MFREGQMVKKGVVMGGGMKDHVHTPFESVCECLRVFSSVFRGSVGVLEHSTTLQNDVRTR